MAKPPPTRTTSEAPLGLTAVTASNASADRKPAPAQPAQAATSASPAPAPAEPTPAKSTPAKSTPAKSAVEAMPQHARAIRAPVAAKREKVASSRKRVEKPKVERVQPVVGTPATKAAARAAGVASRKPETSPKPETSTKSRTVRKAVAPAAKASAPSSVVKQAAGREKTVVADAMAATMKPVVAAAETMAATVSATRTAAAEPPPLSLGQLPPPRMPEVAALTGETVMSQALTMARAFGALQAKMLEHACQEFKATVSDAEKLARSDSASEAVTLQAKAVRRSYESYSEHLRELARIANAALKKD